MLREFGVKRGGRAANIGFEDKKRRKEFPALFYPRPRIVAAGHETRQPWSQIRVHLILTSLHDTLTRVFINLRSNFVLIDSH
jgi:hypothetical protein